MKVAGGFYREEMLHPSHKAFLGSGMRASAALTRLTGEVELHAYASRSELEQFAAVTAAYGVAAVSYLRADPIAFRYAHGCGRPFLDPDIREIVRAPAIELTGDAVLRFGFLEGSCIVRARRAVYDPQSEIAPEPFAANGSCAQAWAMVLNAAEAESFTGKGKASEAARALLKDQGCDVVVVKCGSRGALVRHGNESHWIPAFCTPTVFPLGSGDIFSACFAWQWAKRRRPPIEAATYASRATAFYCANRFLPLPPDVARQAAKLYKPLKLGSRRNRLVYLVGPFFDLGQRWVTDELRQALIDQGLDVFSPIHEVGEGEAQAVAHADLEGLRRARVVLACIDGLDTGTSFEIGYARARGIPVVALATGAIREPDMTMLSGTDCRVVRDVATAIYTAAWLATGR